MRHLLLTATILAAGCTTAEAQVRVGAGGDVTVTEGSAAVVPYVKSGRGRASFSYVTVGQTAVDGRDFVGASGSLSPYSSGAITIQTHGNNIVDGTRTLLLRLTGKGKTSITDPEAVITILDDDVATVPAPAPVPEPQPAPEPAPAPAPVPSTGWEPSPTLDGVAPIASNFDIKAALQAKGIPPSAAPDVVGAFRFICQAGQILADDPIVYPGQPGKSHLHQFYGNTVANASSTYASLRQTGESTCGRPVNRSAYWMPAMLDGAGNVVRPDFVSIYYKRRPKSDPICNGMPGALTASGQRIMGKCVNLPNGLKFIFGYDMLTGKAPTGSLWYNCQNGSGTGAIPGKYASIEAAAKNCPAGTQLGAIIEAPDCWDGKSLDSPNHRDHVSYSYYDPNTGQPRCDDAHPYVIPRFTLGAWFPSDSNVGNWRLSSDEMAPNLPRGTTFHADFWMAWDQTVHLMWEDNCLDKLLNCDSGDLGNGWQIIDAWARTDTRPKLVSVSSLGF